MDTGWTQSAASKGESDVSEESYDLDGLSREQLMGLKTNQSDKGELVNAQAEANDQAEGWAEQWGSKIKRPEEIKWPHGMGVAPMKLMVLALIQAAMTFPIWHWLRVGRDTPASDLQTEPIHSRVVGGRAVPLRNHRRVV